MVGDNGELSPRTYIPDLSPSAEVHKDHFIVCGLGSLGQQIILNLTKFSFDSFEVQIAGIDRAPVTEWEVENLPDMLSQVPIVGDCRRDHVLQEAGIEQCRAILIVTSDESTNVQTAIAVRRLNPQVHIIVRSSRHGLNQLLNRQLGRFVALDATELPAMTFALAGLEDNTLSVFNIDTFQFRVVERQITARDPQYCNMPVHRLHRQQVRLLNLKPFSNPHQPIGWATTASSMFHRWQPHVRVQAGDQVAYVEVKTLTHSQIEHMPTRSGPWSKLRQGIGDVIDGEWRRRLWGFWHSANQQSLRRVVAIALTTALVLWTTGTLLLYFNIPTISFTKAIVLGAILILGGYGDVFGGFEDSGAQGWVLLTCLLIATVSLLMVIGVLGLLADQLLSSRFEFLQRRPKVPKKNHVIVVGLGRVGKRVVRILQDLRQPLVAITHHLDSPALRNQIPLLEGPMLQQLQEAHLSTARSVIAVTDDPVLNLEVALLAAEALENEKRPFTPVIRTLSQLFSDNIKAFLPQARSFSVYALSAEAFAGAAFGENILGLFRLNQQTILITEYAIEYGDTLNGKPLAEIAYGYGVVPILLRQRQPSKQYQDYPMPSDDLRVHLGDKLYVLSSINGLRRIERGEMTPPRQWLLEVDSPLNPTMLSEAGSLLAKLSNVQLDKCRQLMKTLPNTLQLSLYDYQAHRLMQELKRCVPIRLSPLK
ncbi:NAD-binding protein [Leptothoe sp. LEGE 181152]|uniref:Potassium transporter TrkA n=1 Tax=Adonisia turfae CCMR0081 TaxID=2292702 RepID=A0A6M0RWI1_9CYAN|nr:NAD-binding protein [Adonisia turfae]MDV3353648.1 NAD-binding protein [Leptothoe sp. LEGE 181152]NEZ60042.1 potassium transporter TrkA [Adonisia turfae CCMR0081]